VQERLYRYAFGISSQKRWTCSSARASADDHFFPIMSATTKLAPALGSLYLIVQTLEINDMMQCVANHDAI